MKKNRESLTRKEFLFPNLIIPINERLKASNSINLINNHTIIENGNYWEIKPIHTNNDGRNNKII